MHLSQSQLLLVQPVDTLDVEQDNKDKFTERTKQKLYPEVEKEETEYITNYLGMIKGYNALISYCRADTRPATTWSQMTTNLRGPREGENRVAEHCSVCH